MTKDSAPNLLGLGTRSDLVLLSDSQLADRFERAERADDSAKKRYGWLYYADFFSWTPRLIVKDPSDYWFPSHIRSEISDITKEIERRLSLRRQAET